MPTIQDIKDEVASEKTIIAGVSTMVDGLSQQLKDAIANGSKPEDLQAIVDGIEENKAGLAAVLLKGTPAAATEPAPPAG